MSRTLSLSTLTNVLSLSWEPFDTREWAFPHKIGLRIGMHSCSVTCDLETNRQHTCSCGYHMPPREGEGGREFICGLSDDISCSKNCGARVVQTLPTFSHMLSYPQVRAQFRNNSMPLVPGKLGKKPPAAHRIHCTGSICLLHCSRFQMSIQSNAHPS